MNKKKAIPENYMTVGELAKKMGTTVRTLQYYDKEGLLSPTTESEGGRRLYTHKDMIKLHQILSLKSLGFSLDDIKNKLISLDTPEEVANVLNEQSLAIQQKIEQLTEAVTAIETLKNEVLQMQVVDFKKYADIIVTDIKKMYIANGIPLCFGVIALVVSAFIHLMIMSIIIFALAPIVFHATIPSNIPLYFITLALFVIVSLTISCVLGLAVKNQAKLTMYSQVVFLPSIMLSGIMFSAELLPNFLESMGKLFPATWGYTLLIQKNIEVSTFIPLVFILIISVYSLIL